MSTDVAPTRVEFPNRLDIDTCLTTEPPDLDFVFGNFLLGTVGALVSPGGVGKSMLALQLAVSVCGGPDLAGFGSSPKRGKVVFCPAEDPALILHHRLHALGSWLSSESRAAVADQLNIFPLVGLPSEIASDRWCDLLCMHCSGARLLILDTLRRFHDREENSSGEMSRVISRLESVAKRTSCAVMFLHHSSKFAALSGNGDQQQASRGSSALVDNVRWQANLTGASKEDAEAMGWRVADRRRYVRYSVTKSNYGPPEPDVWLERAEGGVLRAARVVQQDRGKSREAA